MLRAIVLQASDNVATLIDGGKAGDVCRLQGEARESVTLLADIPFGHKICIRSTAAGDHVLKYGQVIGSASQAIRVGEHVHDHNVESRRARGDKAGS